MSAKPETADNTTTRLPCRGCQSGCSNYAICDGKPWRLDGQPKPVAR